MNLSFPEFSLICHKKIEDNGFTAWFVGGCVRDALLGRPFTDIDIATNATPDDIIRIFDKTVPTGIKHGTVTVLIDNKPIEVTTFRSEDGYQDSRHPDTVHFKSDINEDLSRRDFTINAIAYHPSGKTVDLFGGLNDLKKGIIKTVNDPNARFKEDALRILRAFRFASKLDFKIEESTEKAAILLIDSLKFLSGERILKELKKLVCGNNLSPFQKVIDMGGLEFCGIFKSSADLNLILGVKNIPEFRLPAFLNLCGFDPILLKNALKIDNLTLNNTIMLSSILKEEVPKSKTDVKLLLSKYDNEIFELYLEFLIAQNFKTNKINEFYQETLKNNEPYKISHLDINGNDILSLGISGTNIGIEMNKLLNKVINNPELNKKEILISLIKN